MNFFENSVLWLQWVHILFNVYKMFILYVPMIFYFMLQFFDELREEYGEIFR